MVTMIVCGILALLCGVCSAEALSFGHPHYADGLFFMMLAFVVGCACGAADNYTPEGCRR